MVQLRSYYSICPLVDRKSFLGVSEDQQVGCGIITLGKNVVTRYKFSDQKQIGGWSSKDHITAPVILDSNKNEYVGVFNECIVKVWKSTTESLDGLKKHKFGKQINRIITDNSGKSILLFKVGDCASLSYALYARKNLEHVSFLEKEEIIIDSAIFLMEDKNYICHVIKQKNEKYFIITCELNTDINTLSIETLNRVEVERKELVNGRIVGITVSAKANPPQVHCLWSDGRLFAYNLLESTFIMIGHVPRLCAEVEVSLAWMGENHIALYGADSSQEGAVLAVFNVLFGVLSCSYPLKMFCKEARLWCLREHILLEATQHLAVIPFILSSHRNTLSLVGSHKLDNSENILLANWGKGKTPWKSKEKWGNLAMKGMSERDICSQYLLPLLEGDDIILIKKSFKDFTDVPENIIVNLITYVVTRFEMQSLLTCDDRQISIACKEKPDLRSLLDSILNLPFVRESMIPYLRKYFILDNVLFLIKYIDFLLTDNNETDISFEFEQKLILWSTTLIDSHYHQLVFSSEAPTVITFLTLEGAVNNIISKVEDLESVIPDLQSICSGKNPNDNVNTDTSSYFIEEIKIKGF